MIKKSQPAALTRGRMTGKSLAHTLCRPYSFTGLMRSEPTYPSAYADGSSCVALQATEVDKKCNFKAYASGYDQPQLQNAGLEAFRVAALALVVANLSIGHKISSQLPIAMT
jgi:hypothetical protein